jgi:hypothetical protein
MKVPGMREAIAREFSDLIKKGPHWEQYTKSKVEWEPTVLAQGSDQVKEMK